ncbi:hypothetical protein ABPG74_002979 [Tetrahymena malaccensis]
MFSRIAQSYKTPSSYAQFRSGKFKKKMLYGFLIYCGLEFYSRADMNTDLKFKGIMNEDNISAIKNCKSLRQGKYFPTSYLPNNFLMAVYGAKFDPAPYVPYEREYIKTKDGGQLGLDWVPVQSKFSNDEERRILIIFHGLTGGSDCNYIKQGALIAQNYGFRTVCVNMRGYNSKLSSPQMTDFTKNDDILEIIQSIQAKYPKANLYGLGISMGANYMLKMAGELKEKCLLKSMVSVSNPWDLVKCNDEMNKWYKKIYNYNIAANFKRNLKQNLELFENKEKELGIDLKKALETNDTYEFHDAFTRKLCGYNDVMKMYEESSCKEVVQNITVPTLCIQSNNDPICVQNCVPTDKFSKNPNLLLVQTQKGSHIDYFTTYKCHRWFYQPALEFLNYQDQKLKEEKETSSKQ